MKKFLLFSALGLFIFAPVSGFAACEPVSCDTSMGNDLLNADTLENTSAARKNAASCFVCEDNYCTDGDIVYTKDMSKFMVCRQSYGWIGDDKWETYTPLYCRGKADLTFAFNMGNNGLTKFWLIDGVAYSDTEATKNNARTTRTGQNVCYYYDCLEGYYYDNAQEKCVQKGAAAPVDSTPAEPTPVNPTPVEPTPVKPTPVNPNPVNPTQSCVQTRCGGLSGTEYSQCITCCYVPASTAVWSASEKICKCVDTTKTFNPTTLQCEVQNPVTSPAQDDNPYECDPTKLQVLSQWMIQYSTNNSLITQITQVLTYCSGSPSEVVFNNMFNSIQVIINQNAANAASSAVQSNLDSVEQNRARNSISTAVSDIKAIVSDMDLTVWRNEEGKFNTARLLSDSIAGVVLGTAGGLITSSVVKKNQVENGFEDIQCTIGGQVVAGWGDEFRVGIQ